MNKITATGRIAADAELRYTPGGDAIANFRLASDVGFGDKKVTNWFACTIFGKRGEALNQYLIKGLPVTVFGSLSLREWANKDGVKQLSPDIRVDEIELQGTKQPDEQRPTQRPAKSQLSKPEKKPMPNFSDMDDEIPF